MFLGFRRALHLSSPGAGRRSREGLRHGRLDSYNAPSLAIDWSLARQRSFLLQGCGDRQPVLDVGSESAPCLAQSARKDCASSPNRNASRHPWPVGFGTCRARWVRHDDTGL